MSATKTRADVMQRWRAAAQQSARPLLVVEAYSKTRSAVLGAGPNLYMGLIQLTGSRFENWIQFRLPVHVLDAASFHLETRKVLNPFHGLFVAAINEHTRYRPG